MKKFAFILCSSFIMTQCTKHVGTTADAVATPYTLKVPPRFPAPLIPLENPLTEEGVLLGHKLYYDAILSSNGLSCSSCHISNKSFSSPLFVSKTGEHISVPPHINLAWNTEYNWNGSQPKLDLLCLGDFGPDFFNTNMSDLVSKLKAHSEYPSLFKKAFNIDDVGTLSTDELQLKIVYAISQFMRTLISSDSKFDKWIRHEGQLTADELAGYEIFFTEKGDCFHCHGYPLMTSNTFNNNGLDAAPTGPNLGYFLVTANESDKGKFSPPTLRNVELTGPYMHDGRFQTLEEVIDFYDSGVHWESPNIDPIMTKAFKKYGLSLSPIQKSNLLKFLKTLTDTSMMSNPNFKKL
ncbi:MAG: cytochrome c peroxidase [bacterium]|nr:cytochrome c peroxidase [bacterium]